MSKTAQMVMKIIGASLALAAFVCLIIGGWQDLSMGWRGMQARKHQNGMFHENDEDSWFV